MVGHRRILNVSTLSRPKAAALAEVVTAPSFSVSTLSRPKAAAAGINPLTQLHEFQHSAARRRLQSRKKLPEK